MPLVAKEFHKVVGIKPPSPQRFGGFLLPIFRKAISETNNLWYNILEVIQTGKYHRERAEYKSHISNLAYISKTNLIFFYGRGKVLHHAYFLQVR